MFISSYECVALPSNGLCWAFPKLGSRRFASEPRFPSPPCHSARELANLSLKYTIEFLKLDPNTPVWFFWFSTYIKKILNYTVLVSYFSLSAPQAKFFGPFCAQGEIPYYFSMIWNDFPIFVSNISRNIYKDFSHPKNVYKDLYICI